MEVDVATDQYAAIARGLLNVLFDRSAGNECCG